ncbi:hypothetical protein M5X00_00590 [Paenibacillus alvei]|uniref:hypothetical protein n=1 Tax=Paenibacillus alvei TaxID=44250 RepID=UPI002281FE38|nr:hypothetical protein [Paenibacillus alvei]MCY9752755.1 hypothetical protein [Paenibacillus alvei]
MIKERELQLHRAAGRCRRADRAEPALPEEQPGARAAASPRSWRRRRANHFIFSEQKEQ